MKKLDMKDVTRISAFAALMSVCAWIWVPGPVPFTLQTFGIFLAAGLLGAKRAVAAVLVYILLGAIGVPVFSGGRAGFGVLLGATGGFIIGFVAIAFISGSLCNKFKRSPKTLILSMLAGLLGCYVVGVLWYAFVYLRGSGTFSIATAVVQCVMPFLIPDILKMLLAAFIVNRLAKQTRIFPL